MKSGTYRGFHTTKIRPGVLEGELNMLGEIYGIVREV
jgi:hypothetical protein